METNEGDPVKILLADDDEDDRSLFQEALTHASSNAKLTTVNDGVELMQYLAQADGQTPDIIFLDINMPRKNGKECLKEIRGNQQFKHIPIIMFSTSSFAADIDETFASGANLYVSKPVFFNDEIKILKKIFSLHWQQDLFKPDKKGFLLHTPAF